MLSFHHSSSHLGPPLSFHLIMILSSGHWVGVRLDEPLGKSDGTAKGVTIFECEENFGAFVRGKNVTVGDYPERDLMGDEEEEDGNDKENGANGEDDEDEI